MAWNARWTLSFDSRKGKQCVVTISEQGYVGNVTALTGGAVPFETQEDDDDDIFMPIRGQSGYIRIVTDDSTLLDSIVPPNELAHLVTLTVDGVVKWRGFQETEMFEQEWYEGNHEVELPVRSLLASLESTHLGNDKRYGLHSLGELFYDLFNSFGIADLQFRNAWRMYNMRDYFSLQLYSGIFFSDSAEGGELFDDRKYSDNGSDIAEALCMPFGIELREAEGTIYFLQMGFEPIGVTWAYSMDQLKNAYNIISYTLLRYPTLAEWVEQWRGTENQESRLKPCKGIDITLDISKNDDTIDILRFPDIEEEDKPVYDLTINGGTLHAQPYPQTIEEELGNPDVQGYLYKWHNPFNTLPEYVGYVRCAETVEHAPWKELFDGTSTSGGSDEPTNLYTGAIPCRWSFDSGSSGIATISTTEGYYMAFVPCIKVRLSQYSPRQMFVYDNNESVTLDAGYLSIDFNLLAIYEGIYGVSTEPPASRWESYKALGRKIPIQIGLVVKIGNQYWNGSAWQSQQYFFYVDVEEGALKSNYSSSMGIAQTNGYLIPVSNMTGEVTISIMDHIVVGDVLNFYPIGRAYFMSNFMVKHHKPSDSTSLRSDRDENKYISRTTAVGYNEVKEVTLKVGTNNYNRDSDTFLRKNDGTYLDYIMYYYRDGDTMRVVGKRPEEELLARMKDYYSVSRKTYRAIAEVKPYIVTSVEEGTREKGLPEIYPHIGGGTYMVVDADHDWREDTQKIKFIEVYRS